eukprot:1009295-Prorocentrum_minimum.AAC.1
MGKPMVVISACGEVVARGPAGPAKGEKGSTPGEKKEKKEKKKRARETDSDSSSRWDSHMGTKHNL